MYTVLNDTESSIHQCVIPPMKSQTILLYNPYVNGNRANKPTMKHRRSLKLLSCGRWWFLQQILRERHTLNDILISSLSTLQSPPQNWYEKIKLYWPSPWYKMKQTPFEKNKNYQAWQQSSWTTCTKKIHMIFFLAFFFLQQKSKPLLSYIAFWLFLT